MGYTHYWSYHDPDPKTLKIALVDMKVIVGDQQAILAGPNGTGLVILEEDQLAFNGMCDNAHEPFSIDCKTTQGMHFCKTFAKPYNTIVTACLTVLQHYLGNTVDVTSDGYTQEWRAGVALANELLGKNFTTPPQIQPCPPDTGEAEAFESLGALTTILKSKANKNLKL